jgi:hypothetical protein
VRLHQIRPLAHFFGICTNLVQINCSSILIEIDIPPESHRKRLEFRGGNEIRLNQLGKP